MATYSEIYSVFRANSALRDKIFVATQVLAATVMAEANPSTTRRAWATGARDNPDAACLEVFLPVLIDNIAFTLAQINAATDAAILTSVTTQINRRYGAT